MHAGKERLARREKEGGGNAGDTTNEGSDTGTDREGVKG